jgi:hypothetical protein
VQLDDHAIFDTPDSEQRLGHAVIAASTAVWLRNGEESILRGSMLIRCAEDGRKRSRKARIRQIFGLFVDLDGDAADNSKAERGRRWCSDRVLTTHDFKGVEMAKDESKAKPKAGSSAERAIEKISDARFLIDEQDAQSADAIAFVHAVMCQIGLPRSPQKERVWTRSNGAATLTVIAGGTFDHKRGVRIEQPLPQGPYARLMIADICTHAVRHKTPFVPMEDSVSAYMRKRLKVAVSGGSKGTYTGFKREALALAAMHMELSATYNGKRTQTKAPPIESFDAWVVDDDEQTPLWPCELELSAKFFASLQVHAAPIDMRAYRCLAHSALAQDIYTWLAHRLPRLKSPLGLPWSTLAEQFGGYEDPARFRKEFLKRLSEVAAVYPDAKVEVVLGRRGSKGGSLLLKPSQPPISRVGVVLPAAIGARAEMDDRIEPIEVEAPTDTFRPEAGGSEACSTLQMHGPASDPLAAPQDPHHALWARVEQLRGWLQVVPKTHRNRAKWEAELEVAESMLRTRRADDAAKPRAEAK